MTEPELGEYIEQLCVLIEPGRHPDRVVLDLSRGGNEPGEHAHQHLAHSVSFFCRNQKKERSGQ
jgi:hypothetical protein